MFSVDPDRICFETFWLLLKFIVLECCMSSVQWRHQYFSDSCENENPSNAGLYLGVCEVPR